MNDKQKKKTKFRQSAKWKKFRHYKNVEQNGKCFVTGKKLLKMANLHHLDMDDSHYEDLSNPEHFVYVNKSIHEVIHTLWRYYKNDPSVMDRLLEVLERMAELNNAEVSENETTN